VRLAGEQPDGKQPWAGYTYEWNEAGTEAHILGEGSKLRTVGDRQWHYPTRPECDECHTPGAGYTLGLELAQLDREMLYPSGRRSNQVATWEHIGLFDAQLPMGLAALPAPDDQRAPVADRARAYLHANCGNCHRPSVEGSGTTDFRFTTPLGATMSCNAEPLRDTLGLGLEARIIAPAAPDKSMVVVRMQELGRGRMPEIATLMVDQEGVALLSSWIRSLTACP
jgi:mono/diheme cytochrome c family protein